MTAAVTAPAERERGVGKAYPPTPRLSQHARERAALMGISTKRVKRIARDTRVEYPAYEGRVYVVGDDPEIIAIVNPVTREVVTVLWRDHETWEKHGRAGPPPDMV